MIADASKNPDSSLLKDETVQFHIGRNSLVLESLAREEVRQKELSKRFTIMGERSQCINGESQALDAKSSLVSQSIEQITTRLNSIKVCE